MPTPREFIDDIKNRQINSDKEFVLDSLTGALEKLEKAFPRYGSFLMEFIQNADDAKSSSLKIEILENTLRIFNDGIPFSEEDVKSVCKVGRSSKTPKDYIGYLGVGFKAVFLISESVEIYSGEYSFKFDKKYWPEPDHTPWQIIPVWIDYPNVEFTGRYKTIFNVQLKEVKLIDTLLEEVKPDHLSDRTLLFLRNVKEIEIIDSKHNYKRKITKSKAVEMSEYEIYQLEEYENDILKNQVRWLLFRSVCSVPREVKEDYVTKDWNRETVDKREVLVAFKLGEGDTLTVEKKGTAHIGVFSFLPLKEVPSGLNFLIQGDFLTTPGRSELARDSLWNNWLAQEICSLVINKCIPTFLKHEKWKFNFTQVLYSTEGGHELFEKTLKLVLRLYLENNPVLVADDGSIIKRDEAVIINSYVKELISKSDLEKIYPNRKVLHTDCKTSPEIQNLIERLELFSESDGQFSSKMRELISLKARERDIEFFKRFYRKLVINLPIIAIISSRKYRSK